MTVIYSPSDVQELLGIDSSTLRKYATLLERHGYHVHRNNRGHRGYFEKDVTTLRKLIEFSKHEDMTMEQQ
jgi:DNA-binding transcriptional MerR regulator